MRRSEWFFAVMLLSTGIFGGPLLEQDLASDTAWTLRIGTNPTPRGIIVPGGGWNSDVQNPRIKYEPASGYDTLVYERTITVPNVRPDQVTRILFGAVTHGADVYIDGKLAGFHIGMASPFFVDISNFVQPGSMHRLKVKASFRLYIDIPNRSFWQEYQVPGGFDYPCDYPTLPGEKGHILVTGFIDM